MLWVVVSGICNFKRKNVARVDVTSIEGFEELNRKLKRLPDRVKRIEVNKLLRRAVVPVVSAYRRQLVEDSGTLRRSTGVKTVPSRKSGGNPVIAVRPGKRGRNDAFYKFMIVRPGTKLGSTARGSRRGKNTVVPDARDRTLASLPNNVADDAADKVGKYVQKQIDRLGE